MTTKSRPMETLSQAIDRLEREGYEHALRARTGGRLVAADGGEFRPEELVVDEVVRFEGASDPDDQSVLLALRTPDGRMRGTFSAVYGPLCEPASAEALQRLELGESRG